MSFRIAVAVAGVWVLGCNDGTNTPPVTPMTNGAGFGASCASETCLASRSSAWSW